MSYDTVVIGAGLAGLVAALRLAEAGQRVLLAARGVGSIQLGPATVDVLGYAPDLVRSPEGALPGLIAANPGHPYARTPIPEIASALQWLRERAGDLAYAGGLGDNLLLATAAGGVKPTALAPGAMAAGDLRPIERVAIAGWRELRDFYPRLVADNLARTALEEARPGSVRALELPPSRAAEGGALALARNLDESTRREILKSLRGSLRSEDAVGFPAVLGIDDHAEVWRSLQKSLGVRVFEIPTLPPSVPGMRLYRRLHSALRHAGARVLVGTPVMGADTDGGEIRAVSLQSAARLRTVAARHYVLASGGFASGGLEMDSRFEVRETIFGLPVAGVPSRGEARHSAGYFERHPLGRAGIVTDDRLRPIAESGEPLYSNLCVAGATLAGAEPWREKSGDGISLATGWCCAGLILEESG